MRERLADLLEQIANEQGFDGAKYKEFQEICATTGPGPVLSEAANTLIEFYNCFNSRSLFGRRIAPNAREVENLRDDLRLFARAIRADITEYRSLKDLRSKLSPHGQNNQTD